MKQVLSRQRSHRAGRVGGGRDLRRRPTRERPPPRYWRRIGQEYAPDIYSQWSPNEKTALEAAIGASLAGARTLAGMKHVGVNVAADPLFTAVYTGVKGGLVLVCGRRPQPPFEPERAGQPQLRQVRQNPAPGARRLPGGQGLSEDRLRALRGLRHPGPLPHDHAHQPLEIGGGDSGSARSGRGPTEIERDTRSTRCCRASPGPSTRPSRRGSRNFAAYGETSPLNRVETGRHADRHRRLGHRLPVRQGGPARRELPEARADLPDSRNSCGISPPGWRKSSSWRSWTRSWKSRSGSWGWRWPTARTGSRSPGELDPVGVAATPDRRRRAQESPRPEGLPAAAAGALPRLLPPRALHGAAQAQGLRRGRHRLLHAGRAASAGGHAHLPVHGRVHHHGPRHLQGRSGTPEDPKTRSWPSSATPRSSIPASPGSST